MNYLLKKQMEVLILINTKRMKQIYLVCLLWVAYSSYSQTEIDGLMMEKNNFCTGITYEYNSWTKYWEGLHKRDNLNFGTISSQKTALNGNYGITDRWNFIFSIPYIKTNASAGTMMGQKGFQDLSLTLKYMFYEQHNLSFYCIGGFSFPTSNYVADYLPLSIGLRSRTGTLRLMTDYQYNDLFVTFSSAYMKRDNIIIDRNTYYTTRMHYTDEVNMPDVISTNARMGYRTGRLIAEAVFDTWITQKGGFDITTNNMPFPSNTMNMTRIGFNGKYNFKKIAGLSLIGGLNHVISGRNIGQSDTVYGGLFYIIDFTANTKTTTDEK